MIYRKNMDTYWKLAGTSNPWNISQGVLLPLWIKGVSSSNGASEPI